MNRKDWKDLCKVDRTVAYHWYNKVRKLLKSKEFESDPRTDKDAKVIHHLRDTEEQRKYNDEHYEMFGFEIDEDGNEHFEYGKYVVFWTKEHHNEYHHCSEETRKKLSLANKGRHFGEKPEDVRKKISNSLHGNKCHFGHHHSSETKNLLSIITRQQMSDPAAREFRHNLMLGNKLSDATKEKISKKSKQRMALVRAAYIAYKANNGSLSWNEFQSYYKHLNSQNNE